MRCFLFPYDITSHNTPVKGLRMACSAFFALIYKSITLQVLKACSKDDMTCCVIGEQETLRFRSGMGDSNIPHTHTPCYTQLNLFDIEPYERDRS